MIEWLATTSYSFLEGVASPEDLIRQAAHLGYQGVAVADRMGLYGLVRAHKANEDLAQPLFYTPGVRLHFDQADPLFVYPLHRKSYGDLCRYLSRWALDGMTEGEKGLSPLPWAGFRDFLRERENLAGDYILISVAGRFYPWAVDDKEETRLRTQDAKAPTPSFCNPPTAPGQCPFWLLELARLAGRGAGSALSLAYPVTFSPGLEDLQAWLEEQSRALDIPLLATSLPLYAFKEDQDLCDVMAAVRHRRKVTELGYLRQANGDRRLLLPAERNFLRARTRERKLNYDPFERGEALRDRPHFRLDELKYHYPQENIPAGYTPSGWLEHLVQEGARDRYPQGTPLNVQKQIAHELALIAKKHYEDYFLTLWDILRYAREQDILFQGRGSAANSIVCYCLGITAIDPVRMELLFERFISEERNEPPDIDVDFEHERREEVFQEVYRRYGRQHAAMVATVICFRSRMAIRETAKALGLDLVTVDLVIEFMGREGMVRLQPDEDAAEGASAADARKDRESEIVAQTKAREHAAANREALHKILRAHKVSPAVWARLMDLAPRVTGLPRHMSIHTGGFVLSNHRLDEMCIVEPARMENRSVLPWDKDDVDALKWMKVDLLSLGILTAVRKSFQYCAQRAGGDPLVVGPNHILSLAQIPREDPAVYRALWRADTVGVFQIESRAQMSMLPRLAPKNFYDIVIEIAIVRPGPLQGGMVHPYLQRRQNPHLVSYDHADLEPILKKTLGVPIFQEQVMKIAVAVAGFTPGEADQLRKVMSGAWRAKTHMRFLKEKLFAGMRAKGLNDEYSQRIYKQIEGFGQYGFPESHSASFAMLAYVTAWLKVHRPAEFLCGLLNSQPMGFYAAPLLIADAERHGVAVLPVDILSSRWDNQMEINPFDAHRPGVRLGFRQIKGFHRDDARILEELQARGILSIEHENLPTPAKLRDLGVPLKTLDKLVRANALRGLAAAPGAPEIDSRRTQQWELLSLRTHDPARPTLDLSPTPPAEEALTPPGEWDSLLQDAHVLGFRTRADATRLGSARHLAQHAREKFFDQQKWITAAKLFDHRNGVPCAVIGLLCVKQRPPTAKGFAFLTLEDETGFINLVLNPNVYERFRLAADGGKILAAEGLLQRSPLFNPRDPRSCSVMIQVTRLWNPFLNPVVDPASPLASLKEIRHKAREYH